MKIKRILSMVLALVLSIGAMSITAFAAEETMYGIGFVNASSLRLRSEPDANSATLVYAPRNDCVVVISKSGEWYKVNYNLQVGYMHQDYLKVLTRENAELGYGEVSGSGVNLRSGPSTTYGKVAVASSGEKCYILGLNNGWYKVIYNGSICYIRSDYLSLTEIPYENQASPNSPKFYRLGKSTGVAPSAAALNGTVSVGSSASADSSSDSSSVGSAPAADTAPSAAGSDIVAEAQKYLGTPYAYGGTGSGGFDCSGFTMHVFSNFGVSLAHGATPQLNNGYTVSQSELQPGDLVFFFGTYNTSSAASHVGIYIGGGQFIHASTSRGVIISSLSESYYASRYLTARRVF